MDFVFDEEDKKVPTRTRKRGFSGPTIVETPLKKASRQRVPTSAMDVDFGRPVERHRRKAPAKVSYLGGTNRKFSKKINFKFNLVTLVWLAFFALSLRLVFMDRGVIDFYEKESLIAEKQLELLSVEKDNIDLVNEIEKIKVNPSYQKMLAREHLGVIAKDEYLILFSKEGPSPSI